MLIDGILIIIALKHSIRWAVDKIMNLFSYSGPMNITETEIRQL